jgi:hypothetical protein
VCFTYGKHRHSEHTCSTMHTHKVLWTNACRYLLKKCGTEFKINLYSFSQILSIDIRITCNMKNISWSHRQWKKKSCNIRFAFSKYENSSSHRLLILTFLANGSKVQGQSIRPNILKSRLMISVPYKKPYHMTYMYIQALL